MGVYSDVLAPPSFGFWFVAVVGGMLTLGPVIFQMIREANPSSNYDRSGKQRRDKRGAIAFGLFSALSTLILIHLFGDQRVFNWLYDTPDRTNATGLFALLTPFGPVFWLLVLIETGVLFVAVRNRSGGYALLSVFFTLLAFQFVTGVPVFPMMVKHYGLTTGLFVSYLILGILWFLWKWDRLAENHRQRYNLVHADWSKARGLDPNSSEYTLQQKADFEAYFAQHNHDDHGLIEYQPRYRDHKSELLGWLMIWPMSMFESLLFDLLAELFQNIYLRLGRFLEAIMLRRWKGTEGHMLTEQERLLLQQQTTQQVVGVTPATHTNKVREGSNVRSS